MQQIYFRYKTHPGDLLRDTSVVPLPDPQTNLENFLIWFLPNYQDNNDVAYLNGLAKMLHNEFEDKQDELKFIKEYGAMTAIEIKAEINTVEDKLKRVAFERFYWLVREGKVEVMKEEFG